MGFKEWFTGKRPEKVGKTEKASFIPADEFTGQPIDLVWARETWSAWRGGRVTYADGMCPQCSIMLSAQTAKYLSDIHGNEMARKRWAETYRVESYKLDALGPACQCGQLISAKEAMTRTVEFHKPYREFLH